MPNPAPILDAHDLSVWRGERCLFRALSIQLGAGELLWLRGANGAGKTTLLRLLAGLGLAETGTRELRADAALLFLGHLDALKRELTPREDLRAWCALHVPDRGPRDIDAALAQFGVAALGDLAIGQLSAGQRGVKAGVSLPSGAARRRGSRPRPTRSSARSPPAAASARCRRG